MKKSIELPDKMSELIRVALGDLREAEKAPDVVVDMGQWKAVLGGICHVCLAGAVMRKAVAANIDSHPSDFSFDTADKLTALDWLRDGLVDGAARCLGMKQWPELGVFYREITAYSDNPAKFYADMEKLADDLAAAGY